MTKNVTISALPRAECDAIDDIVVRHLDDWSAREREVCAEGGRRLPTATVRELRSSGVLSAPVPRSLGGLGTDLFTTARAIRRVARSAPSTALCLAMPLGNAANTRPAWLELRARDLGGLYAHARRGVGLRRCGRSRGEPAR